MIIRSRCPISSSRRSAPRVSRAGVTLVEVIIASSVAAIVAYGAFRLWRTQQSNALEIGEVSGMQRQLRYAVRAVRKGLQPGGYGLGQPTLNFTMNHDHVAVAYIDEFGLHGCEADTVTVEYFARNDSLIQKSTCNGVGRENSFVAGIDTLIFTYYDETGSPAGAAQDVKTIGFTIRLAGAGGLVAHDRESEAHVSLLNF